MNEKIIAMKSLARMINEDKDLQAMGLTVESQLTWIDMGANWAEETIVTVGPRTYQMLSPRQIQDVHEGGLYTVFAQVKKEVMERGW